MLNDPHDPHDPGRFLPLERGIYYAVLGGGPKVGICTEEECHAAIFRLSFSDLTHVSLEECVGMSIEFSLDHILQPFNCHTTLGSFVHLFVADCRKEVPAFFVIIKEMCPIWVLSKGWNIQWESL